MGLVSRSKTSSIWHRRAPARDLDVAKEKKKQMSVFVNFAGVISFNGTVTG
jgi:hypothetical protein